MESIRNVMVIVDPTREESAAVGKAAHIAAAAGARLTLYLCDFSPELDASRFYDSATLAVATEPALEAHHLHLDRLAGPLRIAGLDVHTQVEFHNPLHEGILEAIRRLQPDLVVKDTHYHGVLKRTLLGNTDWRLIRGCQVPLLLARQSAWHTPPRIAAAVDPNHPGDPEDALDHLIVHRAAWLAALLATTPSLVHVFSTLNLIALDPGPAALPGAHLPADLGAVLALRRLHEAQVAALAKEHGVAATTILDGTVVHALPDYVLAQATDIMAIGAVARGAVAQRFIGSTAERVLDRLPCDLLVIHPGATGPA